MRRLGLCLMVLPFFLMACGSPPKEAAIPSEALELTAAEQQTAEEALPPSPPEETVPQKKPADTFSVTQELYDNTLAEVQRFIGNLNAVIKNKNYTAWRQVLSDEFYQRISSPEFLSAASESALMKVRKIVIKTPNDYFTHVVVPSRSNARVDEIEFSGRDRVKVYYLETRADETRRLRLYDLIRSGDTWKIID